MNILRSFTETVVTTPTDTFPISFEYDEKYDAVHVFLNDVAVEDLGYTVSQVNAVTLKVEPAITEGTVRIERETDIDKMKYIFDAGALFIDQNVDADFRQIVHSQQEVRDGFIKLRGDVLPLVHGLQEALQQAQEASEAAQEAANAAEVAAAQTQYYLKYFNPDVVYPLDARIMLDNGDIVKSTTPNNTVNPNVDMTGWVKVNSATQIIDASGKTQQEINDETTIFKAESSTIPVPMINVIRDRIIVDTYAKAGDSSHLQAINRAIIASRDYSQAAIHFNNHDYEIDDTITLNNLTGLKMQFSGGRLVQTIASKMGIYALNCNGFQIDDLSVLGTGVATSQRANEIAVLLEGCRNTKISLAKLEQIRGQSAIRILYGEDNILEDIYINEYSYAGIQVLGDAVNTTIRGFKIFNGRGALSNAASGYGVHISLDNTTNQKFPKGVFMSDFNIHGNNWDGINSHGGENIHIRNGVMTEVKNGVEVGVDGRYLGSYLKNVHVSNVDIECHKNPWNAATQGGITNLASGISVVANVEITDGRYCDNIHVSNVSVKYANNAGGANGTSNAGFKFYGCKGLHVTDCEARECAVQGYRAYGYVEDFSFRDNTAFDVTGHGLVFGTSCKNGSVRGFKFGNSGGTQYTGNTAIQGVSTGSDNIEESDTQLIGGTVTKYGSNPALFLRFKQEEVPASFSPNNAVNIAGFKVGDRLKSNVVVDGVMYDGWRCTAIDPSTDIMTWKRYGATV
ncbi:tailspike protein [Acinetobacter virus fBenAci002]|uniref:Tailspike protein n=1 Tax=Acinetobacter virus fBenAci002 TaxID=2781369 RepID=A0A7S6U521_9CAUD|nr:tailspike protein [Acinetobacter virus fBenAci002]